MSRWLLSISKGEDSTTFLGNVCQLGHTVKECFLKLTWSLLYFSLCPLPLVLSVKGDGVACRESARWKLIHVFHASFQLQCVAQDNPSQNLGFISGKERCKCCSSCWSVFSWWPKMYQSPLDARFGICHVSNTKGVKYYLQTTWQDFFFQNLAFNLMNLSSKCRMMTAVRLQQTSAAVLLLPPSLWYQNLCNHWHAATNAACHVSGDNLPEKQRDKQCSCRVAGP